jgi:hypothetical protein
MEVNENEKSEEWKGFWGIRQLLSARGEKGRWDEERMSRVVIKGGPWAWEEHYVTWVSAVTQCRGAFYGKWSALVYNLKDSPTLTRKL